MADQDQTSPEARPFPVTTSDFESDPRVSFSRLSNKWTLETSAGEEFEYDEALRRWIPVLDEEAIAQQQRAYATGDTRDSIADVREQRKDKKRKQYTGAESEEKGSSSKKPKAEQAPRKNSSIYVTNLPRDVTVDEIREVFSKCGVISEDIDSGKPRIRLYLDDDGKPKGDALVTYFRPESVTLAVQMLDETDLRFGNPAMEGPMRVQEADFSYKVQTKKENGAGENGNGRAKQLSAKDKKKVIKKTQKLNNKLADWDDDDPSAIQAAQNAKRFEKVVILKHMFTLQELEEDPAALLELKEDIREECEKLGEVTNLILYDKEAEGIVSVKYKAVESAEACVRLMNGRFFGGQKVIAYIYDGSERFKKSGATAADDEDEKKRLEAFGDWLENDNS